MIPHRGDAVERWLIRSRAAAQHNRTRWLVINDLLWEYQQHADDGTPLNAEDEGPHPKPS